MATASLLREVESSIPGEPATLEPAADVQARLAIDARSHARLLARFAALVSRVTESLSPEASASDDALITLAEAALLVGARRVTTALARLRAADGDARRDAVDGLRCELRRVSAVLAAN